MSAPADHDQEDDFGPTNTPGYKPTAARTIDEYKKLDANDESLARWKASLGIKDDGFAGDPSKPKLTIQYLELTSSTLPPGKAIKVDISTPERIQALKSAPIQVKEGADYKVFITFNVNHGIVTGVRYMQVVKRTGLKVDKTDAMLGSYSAQAEPRRVSVVEDTFPSGMFVRTSYNVKSRVVDLDGADFAAWEWEFKIAKDW